MVKTRLLVAMVVSVLLGSVGAPAAGEDEPIDFSDAPFVIFAPAPPLPDEISHYPLPDGAEDYWDLWADDAPWTDALEHIDAFATHGWILRYSSSDEDLRRMLAWLDERDIPLAMEVEPLTWPGPDVCDHREGFEGPYDLDEARRIRDLGGHIEFISLDEPYVNAHAYTGPRACGYTVEQVVDEVWDFVRAFRRIHPGVQVGTIEPIVGDPRLSDRDFETWLDTWEERTGEPFAFLSIDVDWRQTDWPQRVAGAEAVADARGVPFGMLYLGSEFSHENDVWLADLAQHAATLEQGHGVTPDLVGFYTWHPQPDRLLPDDDINAYTGRINQYFGKRTALQGPVVRGRTASGRLTTSEGGPLADRVVSGTAHPLGGGTSRNRLSGTVPESATGALIAVRANAEGGTPSQVDVRISDVSYREDGGENMVPNPRFAKGLDDWAAYGSGKVKVVGGKGDRSMRLTAKPKQAIFVDGTQFKVTPGAEYDFAATVDVAGKSLGSGYVSLIFIAEDELARQNLGFWVGPQRLPPVTTSEDGTFDILLGQLSPGRYDVVLEYAGDIDHWAANTRFPVRLQ